MKSMLALCFLIAVFSPRDSNAKDKQVEAIVGYQVSSNGITFQLNSGGCTSKEDFTADVQYQRSQLARLTLIRTRPDTCRPFVPTAFAAHFTFDELGLKITDSFQVMNPNGLALGWLW